MKRSAVIKWIEDNDGQADYTVEYIDAPNPNYNPRDPNSPRTIKAKKVTWVANNGKKLSVLDRGEYEQVSDESTPAMVDVTNGEPIYEVVGDDTTPGKDDNRTPEAKRNDEKLDAQRRKNEQATGYWETDAERTRRENEANDRARQIANDEERNRLERDRLGISQSAEERQRAAQEAADARAAEEGRRSDERLQLDRERAARENRIANRPQVLGTPSDTSEHVAIFNPETGNIESQNNPIFDAAKVEAAKKKEELALAIQMRQMDAQEAAQEYTRWWQQNVELPYKQAAEERARTAERQQAQLAQERNRQFAAQNDVQRAQLGQTAARDAVSAEINMLPYRAGPKFGEQFSSAVNSLAAGGRMDSNASAGINFTADAFEYKRPNLDKIARKATKAALKGLSRYDPDEAEPLAQTNYQNISTPDFSTAPSGTSSIDVGSLWNNLYGSTFQYNPSGTTTP